MAQKGDKKVVTRRGDISKSDYADRLVDAVDGGDLSALGEITATARFQRLERSLPLDSEAVDSAIVSDGPETDQDPVVIIDTDASRRDLFLDDKGTEFGLLSLIFGLISLIMFWVDVGSDLWLVFSYYMAGRHSLAWATLIIVLASSLVTSAFGLYWYFVDFASHRRLQHNLAVRRGRPDLAEAIAVPRSLWIVRFLCTALQLGTFVRSIECLYYGCRSASRILWCRCRDGPGRRRLFGLWYQYEQADLSLLQLLEAFLESAPQLVFQVVVCLQFMPTGEDVIRALPRYLGLASSLVNLATTIHSYHAAQRFSSNRQPLTTLASVLYVLWRLCEVSFRVLVLSVFTVTFYALVFLPVGIHVVIVFAWLLCQGTRVYRNRLLNTLFLLFASYIMVFCFLNLREGFSRWRYTIFYFFFYISNGALLGICLCNVKGPTEWIFSWVYYPLIAFFVCHLVFLLIYYNCCHPSGGIKPCISCRETFWESVGATRRTTTNPQLGPEALEDKRKIYIVANAIKEKQRLAANGHRSHHKHHDHRSDKRHGRHEHRKFEDSQGHNASLGKHDFLA